MLVRDILPVKKIKKIAKERVLGIKPYKTKRAKYFNIGYRIFIGAILIFLIFFSFVGFSFETFGEKKQKAEFYSSRCSNGSEKTTPESSKRGWQNPEKAQGKPEVLASGSIESFSEGNSAVYKGGIGDLLCEGFHETDTKLKYENDPKLSRTVLNSDFDNGDSGDLLVDFPASDISGGSSNISGDLVEYNFESAEIKFSFAIDNNPLNNTNKLKDTNNNPLTDTNTTIIPLSDTNTELTDTNNFSVSSSNVSGDLVGSATADISGDLPNISDNSWDSSPNIDTKIVIWYSIDNETWYSLDRISSYPLSNTLNGGYFSYEAPFLKSWEDVKNLKIKFEGAVGGETDFIAYLDSAWVEAIYTKQREIEHETDTNGAKVKLLSSKKDFKADEEPELKFHYQKTGKGVINSALESLGLSDEWKDIKVKAKIIDANGKDTEIVPDVLFGKNGEVSVKVKKGKGFKPGLYKIVLEVDDQGVKKEITQEFTWGVLAINTNKSIYTLSTTNIDTNSHEGISGDSSNISGNLVYSNEVAYIQMAVLRDDGHTICDASLKLEITNHKSQITNLSTEDGTIQYSGECGANNVTDTPDYFAYYQVGEVGIYEMKLKNLDNGYEITDSFEVRESVPFDVERIGATRIYPVATYEIVMRIKTNQNFNGQVIETVPSSFEVATHETDAKQNTKPHENTKEIVWEVDWKAGEAYELKYQFDAPDVSPYLYLLGPLEMVTLNTTNTNTNSQEEINGASSDISGNLVFREARQWQIAADAPDIAHDAFAVPSLELYTATFSWTHTPVGTPRGVAVIVVQEDATDQVSGVTYGGVSMTRVRSDVRTAAEDGRVYIYFLGSGIPTGARTVTVTLTGTLDTNAVSFTVTAAGDTAVNTSAGEDAGVIANPSLAISPTVASVIYYGLFSGLNSPVTTAETNSTHVAGKDYGIASAMWARKSVAAGATTIGYDAAIDDVCHSALAIYEIATISGTVYQTDETTFLGTAPAMKMAVGAAASYTTTASATDGTFSFTGVIPPAVGDIITIWLDTDAGTDKGSLVFKYGTSCAGYIDCTGLSVFQNRATIDSKNGTSITNANLAACDNDTGGTYCADTDIGFTSEADTLSLTFPTNELHITTGVTFAPGGNASAQKLHVAGTYTGGSETLTLSGSGTGTTCGLAAQMPLCVSGTYTASTNTTKFTGTSASNIALNSNFYNLEMSPAATVTYTLGAGAAQTLTAGGNITVGNGANAVTVTGVANDPNISVTGNVAVANGATFINSNLSTATLNIDGNLTINTTGAFTAPIGTGATAFTLAGHFTNNGTFTNNGGTVTFDGAGGSTQCIGGNTTFYNFTANASSARTIRFAASSTQTVSGVWNIAGALGQLITLDEAAVPSQVTGLEATAGNAQITLDWSAAADNGCSITSYKVYRSSPTNGSYALLTTGGCSSLGNALTCTDTGLTNDILYYYKVSAVNAVGEGTQSDEVSATPSCTLVIGAQTWMCYNMNAGAFVAGTAEQNQDGVKEKYCYLDTEANCATDGGLYQWAEMMQLPYACNTTDCAGSITSPHRGICPSGWHIPTDTEWTTLETYVNSLYQCNATSGWIAKSLASTTTLWTASAVVCTPGNTPSTNNASGFAVFPAGSRNTDGSFSGRGDGGNLWSVSQSSATNSWDRYLSYDSASMYRFNDSKAYGFSVRCLKD